MDVQTLGYYSANANEVALRYESAPSSLVSRFPSAFAPGGRILDIGCGSGRDLAELARQGFQPYGMDGTPEFVQLAQEFHPELKGRVVQGVLPDSDVPFGGGFDGVLCSAVLMHIELGRLPAVVAFIKHCIKPGGQLLYSVPSKRLDATSAGNRDAAGRLFVPDSAGRLQRLFEDAGFRLLESWGNSDSLGRSEVEWVSVLMKLTDA